MFGGRVGTSSRRGGARLATLIAAAALLAAAPESRAAADLYAFGHNYFGQLSTATNNATNNPNPSPTKVSVPGASGQIAVVSAGIYHSLALSSTGQLYAFGQNSYGQLGTATNNGTLTANPTPTQVSLPGATGQIAQISAGTYHSLALTSTGQLYAFGQNGYGQLGTATNNGTNNPNPTPAQVILPGASGQITQIAAGAYHSLVLTATGQLYAFGQNTHGQLGTATNNGTENPNPSPTPVNLPGASGRIVEIAASYHSLALTSTGQLYAFGYNRYGQIGTAAGNGTNDPNPTPAPVNVPGANGRIVQIAAAGNHSLALTDSDQLYAFGFNRYGQLGTATNNGTNNPNPTPAPLNLPGADGRIVQIAGGWLFSLAVTTSGQLYAFGENSYGQLGTATNSGTANPNPVPLRVSLGGLRVGTIAPGPIGNHTLAVTTDLAVATSSLPSGTSGSHYSAALRASGGLPPYRWSVRGLPAGLSIDPGRGALTGTPAAAGGHDVNVVVTDRHGIVASRTLALTIAAKPEPTATPTPEPPVTVATVPTDGDRDGVPDTADRCPRAPRGGFDIDRDGCPGPYERIRATLTGNWVVSERGVTVYRLTLGPVPRGATIKLSCPACGVRQTLRATRARVMLDRLRGKMLRRGQGFTITITKPGVIGQRLDRTVKRYGPTLADRRRAAVSPFTKRQRCIPAGSSRPARSCSATPAAGP
jgi:alpha-tubulin suppressor-like RCC1 family protein